MKILVIGNGFIGASIIQRLESEGHKLLVFSKTFKVGLQCEQFTGDILVFDHFKKILSWKPQIIIHTAWVTTHELYTKDSSNYKYSQFTFDLAKYVADTDLEHLIILGTCAEYGPQNAPSTAGITKLNPSNLYAAQKVVAFNLAKIALLESNTRLSWARVFQPYGPNQDRNRLLPYLIDSIKKGSPIELRNISTVLDWVTVRDIASAISWIINNSTPMEVDIGTSFGFTNLELLRHLESLLGETNQLTLLDRHGTTGNQVSIVGKNSPLFQSGWLPQDSLDLGLEWLLSL